MTEFFGRVLNAYFPKNMESSPWMLMHYTDDLLQLWIFFNKKTENFPGKDSLSWIPKEEKSQSY